MFSIHATMLEQHSESDWHRSSSQFSIWFQDNSHILKTLIIQYIIKISSVSQNIKPNVLETKYVYSIMHLRKALRLVFFFFLNSQSLTAQSR